MTEQTPTQNQPLFRAITVDLDVVYEDFVKALLPAYIGKIETVNMRTPVKRRCIRRSSSGNTHIRIELETPVPFLETIKIRAFLDDDPFRLACDLTRSYIRGTDDQTNRCFDTKIKQGRLLKAGEWIKF